MFINDAGSLETFTGGQIPINYTQIHQQFLQRSI